MFLRRKASIVDRPCRPAARSDEPTSEDSGIDRASEYKEDGTPPDFCTVQVRRSVAAAPLSERSDLRHETVCIECGFDAERVDVSLFVDMNVRVQGRSRYKKWSASGGKCLESWEKSRESWVTPSDCNKKQSDGRAKVVEGWEKFRESWATQGDCNKK